MVAPGSKITFECVCIIERIIAVAGEHEARYEWLTNKLFKLFNPEYDSTGKISQLREWVNFNTSQKTSEELEMLKLLLEVVTFIEGIKK